MENRLYDTEYRFMEIIWEHAPVRSGELVKLSKEALGWKKSTTYTMIKRLSEKGYIVNECCCQRARSEGRVPAGRVKRGDRKEFFRISSELYSRVPSRKQAV